MIGNALLFALTLFMAFALLLGAHLFIWSGAQFSQSLPQLAIDWEVSSAKAHFFLVRTRAHRRNTIYVHEPIALFAFAPIGPDSEHITAEA